MDICTHLVCIRCWRKLNGVVEPQRVLVDDLGECCSCGVLTSSGIYVRHDPAKMRCGGEHGQAKD